MHAFQMGITVRRIAARSVASQLLVEFVNHGADNEVMHQVITLKHEALAMDATALVASLRLALPALLPNYVDDEKLLPLVRQLQKARRPSYSSLSDTVVVPRPILAVPSSSQRGFAAVSSGGSKGIIPSVVIPDVIASIGDLQRVGPAALQAAKAKMDVVFEEKKLKPGDEGFEYDRRTDFVATEDSGWDD